jgi:ribosomal 30S subunit maturation factor RimM
MLAEPSEVQVGAVTETSGVAGAVNVASTVNVLLSDEVQEVFDAVTV